jgi:hypothetical protein
MNKKSRKSTTSSAANGTFFSPSEARVRAKYGIWGSKAEDLSQPQSLEEPAQDSGESDHLNRSVLFYYLVPVVGFFPSLWSLYRRKGTKEQMMVSRLSVTLAFGWLLGNLLLQTGAQTTESIALPLLLVSTVLTSSYFAISVWLMIRLWQRRSLKIPGISHAIDQVVGRHL